MVEGFGEVGALELREEVRVTEDERADGIGGRGGRRGEHLRRAGEQSDDVRFGC